MAGWSRFLARRLPWGYRLNNTRHIFQCFGSGSPRIRMFLSGADPDPSKKVRIQIPIQAKKLGKEWKRLKESGLGSQDILYKKTLKLKKIYAVTFSHQGEKQHMFFFVLIIRFRQSGAEKTTNQSTDQPMNQQTNQPSNQPTNGLTFYVVVWCRQATAAGTDGLTAYLVCSKYMWQMGRWQKGCNLYFCQVGR